MCPYVWLYLSLLVHLYVTYDLTTQTTAKHLDKYIFIHIVIQRNDHSEPKDSSSCSMTRPMFKAWRIKHKVTSLTSQSSCCFHHLCSHQTPTRSHTLEVVHIGSGVGAPYSPNAKE